MLILFFFFQERLIEDWCYEVQKEIAEQKPEFAVIHIQGLKASPDPEALSRKILKW